jgi:hypothetical protein
MAKPYTCRYVLCSVPYLEIVFVIAVYPVSWIENTVCRTTVEHKMLVRETGRPSMYSSEIYMADLAYGRPGWWPHYLLHYQVDGAKRSLTEKIYCLSSLLFA